jgi:CheY-like chemotaxis protein
VKGARLQVRRLGSCVCLAVCDRGRGFDPKELRETIGFGLLSIRERTELLGGRMRIRSTPGAGSVFFVAVPDGPKLEDRRQTEQDGVVFSAPSSVLGPPPSASRLRVLLADDHEIVRAGLVSVLGEEETLEVIGEATNGREAVELADQLRPDVVVMDVSMPVMSGAEATRRIKQDLPRTRIVSLSVVEKPDVREEMYQAGAESYILKTAPTEELLAAIRGEEPDSSENPA